MKKWFVLMLVVCISAAVQAEETKKKGKKEPKVTTKESYLAWKKGEAVAVERVLKEMKVNRMEMVPPVWILDLFERDHENLQRFLDYR